MRQYAWLDFYKGYWRLATGTAHDDRNRKWVDQKLALSDLTAEGWVIDGPYGEPLTMRHYTNRYFYGYSLMRNIH